MRALLAALLAAVLCLLYACASQPAAPSSITEKEMSSMTCDQLTQEQRDFLEQAGLPCPADGKLTQRQVSLLETIRTMLDYLEQKYPGQSFTPVGFSSVSPVRSEDRLYVIPQGGDQKWDLFAVSKATDGTCKYLTENGVNCELTHKIHSQLRPNVADEVKSGQIQLIINTPLGKKSQDDDGEIRRTAVKLKIPYITTFAAAWASAVGIEETKHGKPEIRSLQEYHADIESNN